MRLTAPFTSHSLRLPVLDGIWITDVDERDIPAFLEHFRERDIHDWTLRIPYPYTREDACAWIEEVRRARQTDPRSQHLAVRTSDGLLIGGVGLQAAEHAGRRHQAELGYWLAKPLWGRGIMTAAVRAIRAHAFGRAGFTRLTATVFASNLASARVLEKNGFRLEGTLKRHYERGGGSYVDGKLYAALAP
jgi:[ribosomal protein S5]-alanine N-acetyltransferase